MVIPKEYLSHYKVYQSVPNVPKSGKKSLSETESAEASIKANMVIGKVEWSSNCFMKLPIHST